MKDCFKGNVKYIILAPLLKLIESVFELFVPKLTGNIIDLGIATGDKKYVLSCVFIMIGLGVAGLICAVTSQYFSAKCAYGFSANLRKKIFESGDFSVVNISSDVLAVQGGINYFLRLIGRMAFMLVGATVSAVLIDFKMSILFFIILIFIIFLLYIILKFGSRVYERFQASLEKIILFDDYEADIAETKRLGILAEKITAMQTPLVFFSVNLGIGLVLYFSGAGTANLTAGDITALTGYLTQIFLALTSSTILMPTFSKAIASYKRLTE
jgi:ATP-binding cassette subfamily B protein